MEDGAEIRAHLIGGRQPDQPDQAVLGVVPQALGQGLGDLAWHL